jgi:hypothetical protein
VSIDAAAGHAPGQRGTAFKDLCLDVADAATAATFWSRVLGLSPHERGRNYVLTDDVDEHTLWLNTVPEPKSVKNRVHLDVLTAAVPDLLELGARRLDDSPPWTMLADPEGAEFCAGVRRGDQLPGYRLHGIVIDSAQPAAIATWWADRFGVQAHADADGSWSLQHVPGMPWDMVFNAAPEPKTLKNRVHWDLWGTTEELTRAGATLQRARDDEISWDVLTDPEDNEFCVFVRE